MPPSVAPRAQVRPPIPAIRTQSHRHLRNPQPGQTRLHDHFRGELHPFRVQVQRENRFTFEGSKTAMKINDTASKKKTPEPGKHWIAQPAMQERHGAIFDLAPATPHSAAHHQVESAPKLLQKARHLSEVI